MLFRSELDFEPEPHQEMEAFILEVSTALACCDSLHHPNDHAKIPGATGHTAFENDVIGVEALNNTTEGGGEWRQGHGGGFCTSAICVNRIIKRGMGDRVSKVW